MMTLIISRLVRTAKRGGCCLQRLVGQLNKRNQLLYAGLVVVAIPMRSADGFAHPNELVPSENAKILLQSPAISHDIGRKLDVDQSGIRMTLMQFANPTAQMTAELILAGARLSAANHALADDGGRDSSNAAAANKSHNKWSQIWHLILWSAVGGAIGGWMAAYLVVRVMLPNEKADLPPQ